MALLTGNTAVDSVLTTWLNRKFVSDLEFSLQHQKFTEKAMIPQGAGNIGRFLAFNAPTANTGYSGSGNAPLTESTTTEHEITSITNAETNITPAEFGEFIKIGTLYDFVAVPGTRQKYLKRLGDGAAVSIDARVRNFAETSTNTVYATADQIGGSTTAPATVGTMGASTLILSKKVLFDGLARGFDGINGHPNGHYAAVITAKQELDIVTEVTTSRIYWSNAVVNVPGAQGQSKFVNGYIGSIYSVATYVTQNYVTAALTATADVGFVYADGGVGAMALRDMTPRIVINDVNSPYKNVNSLAWHVMFEAALIASARVVKLYSNS